MEINTLASFFSQSYMPHGHCYLWQSHILWANVGSDIIIAFSYFSIAYLIQVFANTRQDLRYPWIFFLFSAFILLCGVTHLFSIYTVWTGAYGIQGVSKIITAGVSLTTALYLFKIRKQLIKIPTLQQLEGVKKELFEMSGAKDELQAKLSNHKLTEFMLDILPLSTILINSEGQIQRVNKNFKKEFGKLDKTTTHISQIIESDSHSIEHHIKQCLAANPLIEPTTVIGHVICNNKNVPVDITVSSDFFEGQQLTLVSFKNLSKIKDVEQQLLDSHSRLDRAIDATEDGIWEWNIETNEVNYSKTLMAMIGQSPDIPASFDAWHNHIHPDFVKEVDDAIHQHFKTKKKYKVQYLGLNAQQEYGWFYSIGDSIFDEKGQPIVMSGSLRYIHENKLLESRVKEKRDILQAIYQGANQAIWVLEVLPNQEYRFLDVNDTTAQKLSLTREQVVNKTLTELGELVLTPDITTTLRNNYFSCSNTGEVVEYIEMLPQGTDEKWYQTSLYPIYNDQQQVIKVVGTAIDITAQKQVEQELAKNEEFLESIINSAVCGLYLYDLNKQQNIKISQRYTSITGYTLDDLHSNENLLSLFHPDDLDAVLQHMEQVVGSNYNEMLPLEYRFKHKNGNWIWCYSLDTIVERDESGAPTIMLGTFVDVSSHKILLDKLKDSNESLERFAFAASHDLQEPLRKITAFTSSVSQRIAPMLANDEKAKYEMSRLQSAAERMRGMIQDLLQLSRINTSQTTFMQTTIEEIINLALDNLDYLIAENNAKVVVENVEIALSADLSLLPQVFQNLISNSIKFNKPQQPPEIHIKVKQIDSKILVEYTDNGIGIDHKYSKDIFTPFKRLRQDLQVSGSGMGLSICRQIMQIHNGQIQCLEHTNGAKFTLEFQL
ncbi:PAS domain-containing sensor histidine kinase [Saccharobesus litoralis]|uniref:histidine kinase n=1 Tax=Saccharobesus litoralis TaxID=2172099 RepID=A0A2S0VLP1_9ALTE|nr:PAS domain-containing protein [Saccharobesus litoralis]AWB65030.1 PAS domain-containing sensor histidine kinase [Saccharobesus litoralis]